MKLWAPGWVEDIPAYGRGAGTRWDLRSLQLKPFCDSAFKYNSRHQINIQKQWTVNDGGQIQAKLQSTQHGGAWVAQQQLGELVSQHHVETWVRSLLGMGCHAGLQDPEQKELSCVACQCHSHLPPGFTRDGGALKPAATGPCPELCVPQGKWPWYCLSSGAQIGQRKEESTNEWPCKG